ncbi:pumilio domain member 4 [Perkinsus olseni]|uniref:Pumilio domain member 4 n=1 Tax=Perkinsus olseni TaxID=32597 RepID=A0A7J6LDF4_PEROL|nr:pumilio domain member 4 [Perkinsus olseni]
MGGLEAGSVFEGVKGIFEYNRQNFMFNRKINQKRVYHTQKARFDQVRLYREDIRDLFDLTISKMDNYLIVNTLMLAFTGGFFYEGRVPQGTPGWLVWLYLLSLGSAVLFLILSIIFAIHASITAQTFAVRLLTQWLRLPVPGLENINATTGIGAVEYERGGVAEMLRIPVVGRVPGIKEVGREVRRQGGGRLEDALKEQEIDMSNAYVRDELVGDYNLFLEHFYLFYQLQQHWQGFDAYTRVCMVIGTNQLLHAITYMGLAYFMVNSHLWGVWSFILILDAFAMVHVHMNLYTNTLEWCVMMFLCSLPLIMAGIGATVQMFDQSTHVAEWLFVFICLLMFCWIGFLGFMGIETDGGVPTRYTAVTSIDILGLDEKVQEREEEDLHKQDKEETPVAKAVPAAPVIRQAHTFRKTKEELKKSGIDTSHFSTAKSASEHASDAVDACERLEKACRNTEDSLQKLLVEWEMSTECSFTPAQEKRLKQLRMAFNSDRKELARLVGERKKLVNGASDVVRAPNASFDDAEGEESPGHWVRLEFTDDNTNQKRPYFLNVHTSEISYTVPKDLSADQIKAEDGPDAVAVVLQGFEEQVKSLQTFLWDAKSSVEEAAEDKKKSEIGKSGSYRKSREEGLVVDETAQKNSEGKISRMQSGTPSEWMKDVEKQKQEEAKRVARSLESPEFIDGEAPETYKASLKTQTLPWHSFNQACIAVCFCWLFGLAYGIAVLTGYRWGWPDSNPFGNGEFTRRLSAAFYPNVESSETSGAWPPFFRPTGVSNIPELGLVFTSNEGTIYSPQLGADVQCDIPFGERAVDVAVTPSNTTFAVLSEGGLKRCEQSAAEETARMNTGSAIVKAEFLADDEIAVVTREHPQWIQLVRYDGSSSSLVVERVLRAPGKVVGLAHKRSNVEKLYVLWQETTTEEHPDYAAGRIDLHSGALEARATVHGDFPASVEWAGISAASNGQIALVGVSLKDQSPVVAPLRKLRPVVSNIGRARNAETM